MCIRLHLHQIGTMLEAAKLTKRLHVLVDEPTMQLLKAEAERTGESLGDLTREALLALLDARATAQHGTTEAR